MSGSIYGSYTLDYIRSMAPAAAVALYEVIRDA